MKILSFQSRFRERFASSGWRGGASHPLHWQGKADPPGDSELQRAPPYAKYQCGFPVPSHIAATPWGWETKQGKAIQFNPKYTDETEFQFDQLSRAQVHPKYSRVNYLNPSDHLILAEISSFFFFLHNFMEFIVIPLLHYLLIFTPFCTNKSPLSSSHSSVFFLFFFSEIWFW